MYGATAAKVAINKIPLTTNQACCNLIIDEKKADYEFVFYSLWNKYKEIENIAVGAAQQNLSVGVISNLPILLPPLPEQQAIAEVLSSLDDKIDLLHRQNKNLEALAETLFRQWFVEEADESWKEGTLDDILTVKGGATPSTDQPSYWNGTINWTSPRDITNLNGLFLFDTERKITELGLSKISSGLLPKGTLLMTSRAPVGVLAFAEIPLAINQGYIAIIANKGYSREFIYLWLKTNIDLIHSYSNGSTFTEISKTAFKTLRLQIPPHDVLSNFQSIVNPLFQKIKSNSKQILTLTQLRDTLLPKLMSGEVRVSAPLI
jgi:type I restriction enzyme S subunit